MLSEESEFSDSVILKDGSSLKVWIIEAPEDEKAISHELESTSITFLCDANITLKKGQPVTIENKSYYVDSCMKTGIGLNKVRVKCASEQKSGMSLGRF